MLFAYGYDNDNEFSDWSNSKTRCFYRQLGRSELERKIIRNLCCAKDTQMGFYSCYVRCSLINQYCEILIFCWALRFRNSWRYRDHLRTGQTICWTLRVSKLDRNLCGASPLVPIKKWLLTYLWELISICTNNTVMHIDMLYLLEVTYWLIILFPDNNIYNNIS